MNTKTDKKEYKKITISSLSNEAYQILEERRKKSGLSRSNQAKLDLATYYFEIKKSKQN